MNELKILVNDTLKGNKRSLSRLISIIEDDYNKAIEISTLLPLERRKVFKIGVTGSPGTGKSTIISKLITFYREKNLKVGVVAVDPTSPITGGAILGDRIRMQEHYSDEDVFIRSLASRGYMEGTTRGCSVVLDLLSAAKFDVIFVETVGVGQIGFSILDVVDILVLVIMPESGDFIQTMKAGILEIADIIALNKAEKQGAEYMKRMLESSFESSQIPKKVPIIFTSEILNNGYEELYAELEKIHFESGNDIESKAKNVRLNKFIKNLQLMFLENLPNILNRGELKEIQDKVEFGEISPSVAANIAYKKIVNYC